MTINTILYIDDSIENGLTAMGVDPRIDYVASPSLIQRPLTDYDCIITDMKMVHAQSGMEVVERGLREGRLPYVATGGTYEHGGTFNKVQVFNADFEQTFKQMSKADEIFWREALAFIDKKDGQGSQQALRSVRETLGVIPEDQIAILMELYKGNYQK
ncbi:hypothetical protein COU57_05605 [Candidatus Pacearchaeota archaeon CG10_big_fil_rev_8_21_14_0_10_32_14]|nr:MAG: hypothetical protein COU57_05605 [Candidatus Pacearchaeota archaeon CG10_big_fil_rev_8_21_14_0_10_32_14]